jgi:hypothetical protein
MISKNKLLVSLLLIIQLGCSEAKIEMFDADSLLRSRSSLARKTKAPVNLNLCKMNSFKWDRIIIVAPYSTSETVRKYNLKNSKYVEKHLLGFLYQETHCLLLFVDQNTVTKYSYVSNVNMNFNYINNTNTNKLISRGLSCKIFVKDTYKGLKLFYP